MPYSKRNMFARLQLEAHLNRCLTTSSRRPCQTPPLSKRSYCQNKRSFWTCASEKPQSLSWLLVSIAVLKISSCSVGRCMVTMVLRKTVQLCLVYHIPAHKPAMTMAVHHVAQVLRQARSRLIRTQRRQPPLSQHSSYSFRSPCQTSQYPFIARMQHLCPPLTFQRGTCTAET